MKRIVGILFFALFTCLLNAQEVKQIEKSDDESGFKWREVYNGQNWGVQSVSGQEIIPCQFLSIYYSCGYFIVSNGKCNGLFDLKGKEILVFLFMKQNMATLRLRKAIWLGLPTLPVRR